jgi:hypothetical protein
MMRSYEDAIRVFVDTLLYIQRSKPMMVAQTFQNDAVRYFCCCWVNMRKIY